MIFFFIVDISKLGSHPYYALFSNDASYRRPSIFSFDRRIPDRGDQAGHIADVRHIRNLEGVVSHVTSDVDIQTDQQGRLFRR